MTSEDAALFASRRSSVNGLKILHTGFGTITLS
jgi:hypothetical protein